MGIDFGHKLEFRSSGITMYDGIVLHIEYQILKVLILFSLCHGEKLSILASEVLGARRMVMLLVGSRWQLRVHILHVIIETGLS